MKTPICLLLLTPMLSAVTLSFGPTGASPVSIAGTDDGSGGLISYTSSLISNGAASASTHLTGSGTLTNSLGSSTLYDGTFFDPSVDGSVGTSPNFLTTRIASDVRSEISGGASNDYENLIGFSVSFSAPIELFSFGFVDLDGEAVGGGGAFGGHEWASSFAVNGSTLVLPSINAGPGITISNSATTNVNWTGLDANAPTTASVAIQGDDTGNLTPNDSRGQIAFDYGGALVTDLYFMFGINEAISSNGNNNSGVTGFTVVNPVPEPSSAVLLSIGAFGFLMRRKRA